MSSPILKPTSNSDIANNSPLSYIDANDSPPTSCSVNLPRDCESTGCIVSAIANYTRRVNDDRLSATNRKQAMEFLIHFLGDITQPLHVEALKIGGNDIPVTWDGEDTNLHSVWDTQMVEKAAVCYIYSASNSQIG